VTVIALNRLGRNEGASLVHQLAGNRGALPPDVVDEIVERTDGVPLFVEELTKAVVEVGAERGNRSMSAVPPSSLAVPATLHASLLGRLDRLGPSAKNVAQVGAAIGRDFSHELLAAAAPLAKPELQEALRRLIEAGLVFQRGMPPAAEYLFKHALVQDTAYSTLLRGPRQALHRRIAEALEQQFRSQSKRGLRSSRITTAKPPSPTRRSAIGTARANCRWPNQPCVRQSRNCAEALACWTGCPKLASANSRNSISTSP
jgi:predicted ATPase